MSDAKKDAAAHPPPAPAEGGKSSKLLPMLVGLNSLLLVGVLGFMGFQMMHKPAPAEPAAEGDAPAEEAKAEPKEEKKAEKKEEHGGGGEEKKAEGEGHGGEGGAHAAPGKGPGPMVKLSDFIIHLRNPELDRYARMSFDVEVMGETDKDALNSNLPRVRDAFITYLSDRTLEELRGSEGLSRTKDALQGRLRDVVPEARVKALYISDFVVQ